MRIRMTRATSGEISGVNLLIFQPGSMYEVSRSLGDHLIATAAAEFVPSEEPALLLPCSPQRRGTHHRREAAGSQRQRRNDVSMFTYERSNGEKLDSIATSLDSLECDSTQTDGLGELRIR